MSLVIWLGSFAAAAVIAIAAYRARALSASGAIAATIIGGLITAAGGWRWGALLIGFFISASLLSKLTDRLRPAQGRNIARGSRRDAWQVLANGGIATLCAVLYGITDAVVLPAAFAAPAGLRVIPVDEVTVATQSRAWIDAALAALQ